jgi:hypothetical protein
MVLPFTVYRSDPHGHVTDITYGVGVHGSHIECVVLPVTVYRSDPQGHVRDVTYGVGVHGSRSECVVLPVTANRSDPQGHVTDVMYATCSVLCIRLPHCQHTAASFLHRCADTFCSLCTVTYWYKSNFNILTSYNLQRQVVLMTF